MFWSDCVLSQRCYWPQSPGAAPSNSLTITGCVAIFVWPRLRTLRQLNGKPKLHKSLIPIRASHHLDRIPAQSVRSVSFTRIWRLPFWRPGLRRQLIQSVWRSRNPRRELRSPKSRPPCMAAPLQLSFFHKRRRTVASSLRTWVVTISGSPYVFDERKGKKWRTRHYGAAPY